MCMDGASRLLRLANLAQELGAEPVAEEARELATRVSEGRFYVACIGQFKRGKSTLLNALVGHEVVPTGFVPVTAVPTVIRFGDQPHARVRMTKFRGAIELCCRQHRYAPRKRIPYYGQLCIIYVELLRR